LGVHDSIALQTNLDIKMKQLSYPSEQDFLDYSKALCEQMPNIKLNTLRNAMANVDHFRNTKSYRSALKASETVSERNENSVFLDRGNVLHIRIAADIPYGIEDCNSTAMVSDLNEELEIILGGEQGYLLQDFSTEKRDDGLYDVCGCADLDDVDLNDVIEILEFLFKGELKDTFNTYRVAKHAFEKATDHIKGLSGAEILELEETEYPLCVEEYMLPFSSDEVRDAVNIQIRETFEANVKDEFRDSDISLEQLCSQTGQDIMASIIEDALRKIKVNIYTPNDHDYIYDCSESIIFSLASDLVLNLTDG
jgi:hypothetical protein